MNELLEASARFPTVVFTIGLGIALIYWLFVLLGALDIDLFGAGDAAAAAKGGGAAIGDVLTGGSKGGAEALKGLKVGGDGHGGDGGGGGVLDALGLTSVPITISMSAIFLLGWIGSLLGMDYGARVLGGGGSAWLPALVCLVVVILVLPAAGLVVRPLRSVFELKDAKRNRDYVGHTCTITTGQVDADFGQAMIDDHGTVLVIPVRCDRPDAFGRGHRALIIDFDEEREAYVVEPADLGAAADPAST